jgi:hypothetical protein
MAWQDISEEDRAELIAIVKAAIAGDRYPLSPRVRRWRAILAKLDPESVSAAEVPTAAPARPYEPSILARRQKRRADDAARSRVAFLLNA